MNGYFESLKEYDIEEAAWRAALALIPRFEVFRTVSGMYVPELIRQVALRRWTEGDNALDSHEEFLRVIQRHWDLVGCFPKDWEELELFLETPSREDYKKGYREKRKNPQSKINSR